MPVGRSNRIPPLPLDGLKHTRTRK
ncbi:hypothetical protein SMAC4_13349 [Sordaria macrospora]|nr:hypothetical protein SMAC4_13349 [Sordaria macrospora]